MQRQLSNLDHLLISCFHAN